MSEPVRGSQKPVADRTPRTYGEFLRIVTHPAFRIGFLDAQCGRAFDHDKIVERIHQETPPTALRRLGWDAGLFSANEIEVAQYRYEEGRLAVIQEGLSCRSWNYPDFPPAKVRDHIHARADSP